MKDVCKWSVYKKFSFGISAISGILFFSACNLNEQNVVQTIPAIVIESPNPVHSPAVEPGFTNEYLLSFFQGLDFGFPLPIPNYPFVSTHNNQIDYISTWAGSSYDGSTSMNLQSGAIGGMAYLPSGDLQIASGIWSEVDRLNMRYKPNGTPGSGLSILNQIWFVLGSNLITANSSSIYMAVYLLHPGGTANSAGDPDCYPGLGKAWIGVLRFSTADPAVPLPMPNGKHCGGAFGDHSLYVFEEVNYQPNTYDLADHYFGGLASDDFGHLAVSLRSKNEVVVYQADKMIPVESNSVDAAAEAVSDSAFISHTDAIDDAVSLAKRRKLLVPSPGQLALVQSRRGTEIFVISNESSVKHISLNGNTLPDLPLTNIEPVAIASYRNEVVVATGRNDNRLYFFKRNNTGVTLTGTYGVEGGYKAQPVPGIVNASRLPKARSIALSANRLAYSGANMGGSLLYVFEKTNSSNLLSPLWEANSETLIASGSVYGSKCDRLRSPHQLYAKLPGIGNSGRDWKRVAITTNFDEYSEDYRGKYAAGPGINLHLWDENAKIYRDFVTYVDQAGQSLIFYKHYPGISEILEPSTFVGTGNSPGVFARPINPVPAVCAAEGPDAYWWCSGKAFHSVRPDANGKYSSSSAQWETPSLVAGVDFDPWQVVTLSVSELKGTVVVPGGNFRFPGTQSGIVRLFPLKGFDVNGNPKYEYSSSISLRIPEVPVVERAIYDDANDALYVMGYPDIYTAIAKTWGVAGLTIHKYTGVSSGQPLTLAWKMDLPEAINSPYFAVKSLSLSNNLLFAGILQSTPDQAVYVVDTKSGSLVGTIGRNNTWNAAFSLEWIDSSAGVQSCYNQSNSNYTVTAEGLNGLLDLFYFKY